MNIHLLSLILFGSFLFASCKSSDPPNPPDLKAETENKGEAPHHQHATSTTPTSEPSVQRDPKRLWCKEHNRYEDRCWLCHPELKGKQKTSTSSSTSSPNTPVLMCKEHGVAEHECAVCHPDLASGLKPGESLKINLSSKNSATKAGIQTGTPTPGTVASSVKAYCTVDYNQDQVTQVTPVIEGVIRKINVTVGQKIRQGEVLAILHSPELAEKKAQFLSAIAQEKLAQLSFNRQQQPSVKKVSSASKLESAEAVWHIASVKLAAARQQLLNLDLSEKEIAELIATEKPTATFLLRAPFGGRIVKREASLGKLATPGTALFTLVDPCSMWLELSLSAPDAAQVTLGMPVTATFNAVPDETFTGELIWIDSQINPKTRRARARALIEEPPASLRKGLFGQAVIHLENKQPALKVPTSAIQKIDNTPFVFIKKTATLFAATRVVIAKSTTSTSTASTTTTITQGISPTDLIVISGSYIMRSEFLKSQLGAGCVDD